MTLRKVGYIGLTLVTGAALFATGTRAAAERSEASRPALSLSDFDLRQAEYCEKLAEYLNEPPVDWHIVLDVSGSYKASHERELDTLFHLLRSLPLQVNDTIQLDTFGESYQEGSGPGRLAYSWIQALQDSESRSKSEIETWLFSRKSHMDGHTNLQGLIGQIRNSTHSKCPKQALRYYVVLTDGLNEPPQEKGLIPLFTGSNRPSFLEDLRSFVTSTQVGSKALDRGILFVIDQRFGRNAALRKRARTDWLRGIRELKEGASPSEASLRPQATIWDSPADERIFEDGNSLALGRNSGIFPCFVSDSVTPSATATGKTYPSAAELGLPNDVPPTSLTLPDDVLNGTSEELQLNLEFLVRGNANEILRLDVKRMNNPKKPENWPAVFLDSTSISSTGNPAAGWTVRTNSISIPISAARLENFPLPWNLDISFEGKNGRSHFFSLTLDAPRSITESLALLERDFMKTNGIRGRGYGLGALVFGLLSLLVIKIRESLLKISIEVYDEQDQPLGGLKLQDFGSIYHRRQVRYKIGANTLKKVVRQNGPSIADGKNDEVEVDIIPIFGMVYHVQNYSDPSADPPKEDSMKPHMEHFSYDNKQSVFGFFYKPNTFWRYDETDQGHSYVWKEEIKLHQKSATDNEEPKAVRVVTRIKENSLTRSCAWLTAALISFAFAFACLAWIQSMNIPPLDSFPLWWMLGATSISFALWAIIFRLSYRGIALKFCQQFSHWMALVISVILVNGMLFPIVTNSIARFVILLVVVGNAAVIGVLCNSMLKRRIAKQESLSHWELVCEWFLQVSPILL